MVHQHSVVRGGYPSVTLQAVMFMDDIFEGGAKAFVEAVMQNCKMKEIEKLWELSSEKSS